jgi:hypothetical protein
MSDVLFRLTADPDKIRLFVSRIPDAEARAMLERRPPIAIDMVDGGIRLVFADDNKEAP